MRDPVRRGRRSFPEDEDDEGVLKVGGGILFEDDPEFDADEGVMGAGEINNEEGALTLMDLGRRMMGLGGREEEEDRMVEEVGSVGRVDPECMECEFCPLDS